MSGADFEDQYLSDKTFPLVDDLAIDTVAVEDGEYQYDQRFLTRVIEGALLANGAALTIDKLLTLFDDDKRPSRQQLMATLQTINDGQHDRGFVLREVASGWRFEVCDDLAPWVNRLWEEKPQKYSRALLETLALIAYRQPLTRGDIEDVRGVAVSSHIIKTLIEREWVKVVGHRDVPGRPALFATTRQFLDYFGLKSLDQLPSLGELKDIESLTEKLALNEGATALASSDDSETLSEALGDELSSTQNEYSTDESVAADMDEISHKALTDSVDHPADLASFSELEKNVEVE